MEHGKLEADFQGEASYYSIVVDGERHENAVWTYEAPFPDLEEIRDHLAFYPDRVEILESPKSA